MNNNQVYIRINIDNNPTHVKNWFVKLLLFTPNSMSFRNQTQNKHVSYKKEKFFHYLNKETMLEHYNITCGDMKNTVRCINNSASNGLLIASAILDKELYIKYEEDINKYIDELMNEIGIVAYVSDLTDDFWQNNKQVEMYDYRDKSIEGIPLKADEIFKDKMAVDVEKLPGYGEQIDNIWFGAAWKMWFGEPYYEFISKESIEKFKDCYKNEKITDNCRCITLYEDMDDYKNPENRERQWKFKETIDFQNVVERLRETGINSVDDPELEIETGNFEHGGVRLFKEYFDSEGNSVPKSKASKMRITEHGKNGGVVWEDEQNISLKIL